MTLTCISCDHPLYPDLACITSTGWRHVRCPQVEEACDTCSLPMVTEWEWRKLTARERHAKLSNGHRRKSGPGTCSRCAHVAYKAKARAERERARSDRIEDLRWMADHGESLIGAASRLDITESALEHFLVRHECRDLLAVFISHNPRDHNSPANRVAVVRAKREQVAA